MHETHDRIAFPSVFIRRPFTHIEAVNKTALQKAPHFRREIEMSVTTVFDGALNTKRSGKSAVARFFANVIRARELQAQRQVAETLLKLDDASLAAIGRDRATLRKELAAAS